MTAYKSLTLTDILDYCCYFDTFDHRLTNLALKNNPIQLWYYGISINTRNDSFLVSYTITTYYSATGTNSKPAIDTSPNPRLVPFSFGPCTRSWMRSVTVLHHTYRPHPSDKGVIQNLAPYDRIDPQVPLLLLCLALASLQPLPREHHVFSRMLFF